MTRPLAPTDIRCKDGTTFKVMRYCGGHITVFATFRDDLRTRSGLSRYSTFHEPGDAMAEHTGMPVEIVRAYARLHGGVAEAGPEALALLKQLPSQAAPPASEPAPDSQPPAVEEAAPEAPLPEAREAVVAGRAEAPAASRALDCDVVAPRLHLDELTQAVIEARRAAAECEGTGPLKWRWGPRPAGLAEEVAVLQRRVAYAGHVSRLLVVGHARYATHPLLAEGIALRARLRDVSDAALRELRERAASELARRQEVNGIRAS